MDNYLPVGGLNLGAEDDLRSFLNSAVPTGRDTRLIVSHQLVCSAMNQHTTTPLIQMAAVTKVVVALDNVTVHFRDGEIHAIVGEMARARVP